MRDANVAPGGAEIIRDKVDAAPVHELPANEPPRPLARELPPPEPYPVDALGGLLGDAARGIHGKTQAPLAICAQSVLAAACLAAQGHADITLPMGTVSPLSCFFMSIAESGERKSSVDRHATWAAGKHEKALRERYEIEKADAANELLAWEKAREAAIKKANGEKARIKAALDNLGPRPAEAKSPLLLVEDATIEGLHKALHRGQPSVGAFTAEGGQFIGGHGMSDDAKMRTATGYSKLWDKGEVKRTRATDTSFIIGGRRVAMHLMAQPDVANVMLSDRVLADQGLLSRILVTAPQSTAGTRFHREASPIDDVAVDRYGVRLLGLHEMPLPYDPDLPDDLAPRAFVMADAACRDWWKFHDHVEAQLMPGGDLAEVKPLANKSPEHAARIAGVLAMIANPDTGEVSSEHIEAGIEIVTHYLGEALRLFGGARLSPDIRLAQELLAWLRLWRESAVSLPDIYQLGPTRIRDAKTAGRIVGILQDHGHLLHLSDGAVIAGSRRRDAWRIVKG